MRNEVNKLKRLGPKEAILEQAYGMVVERYSGGRVNTFLRAWQLLVMDTEVLWSRPGFLHCTKQNRLLAELLLGSGKFTKADIKRKWVPYWGLSPHQYLKVKVGKSWVAADPWSATYGIKLGDYAHWFHTGVSKI